MTFRVTILGNGAAMPTAHSHHSAHALNVHEQFYLVDCGEGTQSRLVEQGINPLKINAIFISHLHGDHLYGLFPLISTMGLMGRGSALKVFAPAPFGEILDFQMCHFEKKLPFKVVWHEVDSRKHEMVFQNKVMEVWSIPLRHRIASTGYLFREKQPPPNISKEAIERYSLGMGQIVAAKRGEDLTMEDGIVVTNSELTYTPYAPRSYGYCSDTLYSARVAKIVQGVDLLYHEATFSTLDKALAKQTGHSTAEQAAKVAAMAGVGKLIIGHFSSRYKNREELVEQARTIFPNTFIAREGESFDV